MLKIEFPISFYIKIIGFPFSKSIYDKKWRSKEQNIKKFEFCPICSQELKSQDLSPEEQNWYEIMTYHDKLSNQFLCKNYCEDCLAINVEFSQIYNKNNIPFIYNLSYSTENYKIKIDYNPNYEIKAHTIHIENKDKKYGFSEALRDKEDNENKHIFLSLFACYLMNKDNINFICTEDKYLYYFEQENINIYFDLYIKYNNIIKSIPILIDMYNIWRWCH